MEDHSHPLDFKSIWEEQHQTRLKGAKYLNENTEVVRCIMSERAQYLNPMMSMNFYPNPLNIKEAKGIYMLEENGQVNLDCINNVSHIGHCSPEYVARLQKQVGVLNTNSRYLYHSLSNATKKILAKLPKQLSVLTFCNSGTQANDLALQMAQMYTGKQGIVCLEGAYHGISKSTMNISPYKWNQNFPTPTHVTVAKSACTYRGDFALDPQVAKKYTAYLDSVTGEGDGAFIAELMQSCAGQVIPSKDVYKEVYQMLKDKGIVTIADEVQTGFGRLGSHFWAFEYYEVVPDIVVLGKAMGGGVPIGAVVCKKSIADAFKKRDIEYFSTFGGNPLVTVAAQAVLDIIESQKLQQNAHRTGQYLSQKLAPLLSLPFVGDIRGVGLFQGIQIVKDKQTKQQDGEKARQIIMRARQLGVLLSRDGIQHNIIKIKPPIVFNEDNVDQLMKVLEIVLKEVSQ